MPAADDRLARYARLAVRVGLNLQPGQTLAVNALLEHAPLADQQIGGVTMASEQAVVLFVVFFYWFGRFLAEEGAT